jgi:hypothetical protein
MALYGNSYLISLTGNGTGAVSTSTFTINIINPCLTETLSSITIPNLSYPVGTGILNYTFSDWNLTNSLCAPITYSGSINRVAMPFSLEPSSGYISLDPNAKTIQVLTSNFSYIGQ